jgi:hypothetical protein
MFARITRVGYTEIECILSQSFLSKRDRKLSILASDLKLDED